MQRREQRGNQQTSDRHRMEHMLRAARDATTIATGRQRAQLDSDVMLRHALVHCVEVIGEAAARVTDEGRSRAPQLPWSRIVGMRHILVHNYYEVDLDAVWGVVHQHIPHMVPLLEVALREWPHES